MTTGFRADVEGLRALAVVPIVAFHLNEAWCPGGFIGVDIFFVISGYLISRMILGEGDAFWFRRFYVRRFFRLFPALLATCLGCVVYGWWVMPPEDYAGLAASALAASLGVSNFYFYFTLDYFSAANVYHPLLHTWSLGVEEQFYLIWPALLVFLARPTGTHRTILALLLVGTAGLFVVDRLFDPSFAFYMMPLRIFEFAAGASLLGLERWWSAKVGPATNFMAGAVGMAALTLSFAAFNAETPWPGPLSLIPTVGTGLLILSGGPGPWHAFLANRLFRGIGRISYSLYLVHWPVVVFHRYSAVVAPTALDAVLLAGLMVGLAVASYLLIERPFRLKGQGAGAWTGAASGAGTPEWGLRRFTPARMPQRVRAALVLATFVLFVGGSAFVLVSGGVPARLADTQVQHADKGLTFAGDLCSRRRGRCSFGARTGQKIVYLMGDSHALNWIYGLDKVFARAGIHGVALYDHGCLFARGTVTLVKGRVDEKCRRNVEAALDHLAKTDAPVILALGYQGYRGTAGDRPPGTAPAAKAAYYDWLETRLAATLDGLGAQARKLVIVRQTYSTGIDLPKCALRPGSSGDAAPQCPVNTLAKARRANAASDSMIDRLKVRFPHALIIDPKAVFCSTAGCTVRDGEKLFLRDPAHLTNDGSAFLAGAVGGELVRYLVGG